MFVINLFLFFSLILSRLERPYQEALTAYCQDPRSLENLEAIWRTGKRFLYMRHLLSSIMSGRSPTRFLHEITSNRIRDDVQARLREHGLTRQFISLKGLISYVEDRLAREETFPQEFKDLVKKHLDQLGQHPWVEEEVNEYLRMALETPEKIHNPEWSLLWEKTSSQN
jgi:hypothetical protein